jgi:tetratricopeptide (TPR) repeat protein
MELPEAHFERGLIATSMYEINNALAAYERPVELAPGIARYRLGFAQILANVLRFDEAIEHLKAARRLDPMSTTIDGDLGVLLIAAGRSEEAVEHCERGIDLIPENHWAHRCLLDAHYFNGDVELSVAEALWRTCSRGIGRWSGSFKSVGRLGLLRWSRIQGSRRSHELDGGPARDSSCARPTSEERPLRSDSRSRRSWHSW